MCTGLIDVGLFGLIQIKKVILEPPNERAVPADTPHQTYQFHHVQHRKIRLIECNAKRRYLKKWPAKGTFLRQVFYLSEAPFPPMTPYSPTYTLCTLYSVHVYRIPIHTVKGGGGGRELTREKVRCAMLHKAVRKYQHD